MDGDLFVKLKGRGGPFEWRVIKEDDQVSDGKRWWPQLFPLFETLSVGFGRLRIPSRATGEEFIGKAIEEVCICFLFHGENKKFISRRESKKKEIK